MINPAYTTLEEYGQLLLAAVRAQEDAPNASVPRPWHPEDIGALFATANESIMASLTELVKLRSTQ
jgi:hypothetical protein